MRDITVKNKCLRKFLENPRFLIDTYQRLYEWQTKHLWDLLRDLCDTFLDSDHYEEHDESAVIEEYETYFLGSIILYENNGHKYIIDGQQRLITITL